MKEREKAFELLKKHIQSERLIKHCLAVEAGMIAYAKKYGQDADRWASIGLLHDIDYEKYPDEHPARTEEILKEYGYDDNFIKAILGHAEYMNISRDTLEAKVLFAVDEMCSFIVACALVRDPKSFETLEVKSVQKKMKDKAFAKPVSRENIAAAASELGVEIHEHIETLIGGLKEREAELNSQGMSLIN